MAFIDRIQKDLTEAMKSKDELRLSVLRMVKTALKNKEIEKIRPLDDAESLQILQTLVKQRKESVEQFTRGGRMDLADKETREIAIIETYLPAAANDSRNRSSHRSGHRRDLRQFAQADGRGDQSGARAPRRQDRGRQGAFRSRARSPGAHELIEPIPRRANAQRCADFTPRLSCVTIHTWRCPKPFPFATPKKRPATSASARVVRQSFRPHELLDMVLSVTGKDAARIRQILRSGTVVFHFYRYWWTGFDVDEAELAALLARFPDPDPSREFRGADCTMIAIESGATPPRPAVEVRKKDISHRRLFRRKSFWDALLAEVAASPVAYQGYSFAHHADLYRLDLGPEARARLISAVASLASREMRKELQAIGQAARVVFICPRA